MRKPKSAAKFPSKLPRARQGKRGPAKASAAVRPPASRQNHFPIVAIGASAGGLEALEIFFNNLSPQTGMAFVVVTHQHPGHTSLLPELLGKRTRMPVVLARDGQRVAPDCVYISSPEQCLEMLNGELHLTPFKEHDGMRLPIDYFFRSLAEDQRERAIGIILSGTGTDGTLGLQAIKGAAGITLAQEPGSAKYSGMPASAIATGMVDYILRPEQMPKRLMTYGQRPYLQIAELDETSEKALPEAMQKIILLLRMRTHHDFSAYKPSTIRRRIERRMSVHSIQTAQDYLQHLRENPHELDLLFKELLIGVTKFFRDPYAFEALTQNALAGLMSTKPEDAVFRVWVPGCSSGEEVYTLAILVRECVDRLNRQMRIQIFGTDLDDGAIEIARAGLYPDGIAADVPAEYLSRYFVHETGGYRIKKQIRELVIFAPQNVIQDPLFTKLDLLSCRNLLIYLKAEVQQRLFSLFHYALRPGGILMLGPSESLGEFSRDFEVLDKKGKIFARKETLVNRPLADFPAATIRSTYPAEALPVATMSPAEPKSGTALEQLLVKRFVPASVIINARGDISYIHGRTGDYLEPTSGRPRSNLMEMARDGLRFELASVVRRALTQEGEVVQQAGPVTTPQGTTRVRIGAARLTEPESVRGLLLVTFQPLPEPLAVARGKSRKAISKKDLGRQQELERELHYTRESLQSTVEELQSANEELQSTNEELQSTNEELETSKEEMQSLNEELQTVNAQLQTKVDALSETNDDMQNLLNSTTIATIFLDSHLKIKRFTDQARSVINLIPSDVGRPIGDLVSNLNYDELATDAAEVLHTLHSREREVRTKEGGWRLVRILPYRTTENVINGLVITFVDVNRLKEAEVAAQQARLFAENIVATVREPMLVLDTEMRVISASGAFYRFFKMKRSDVETRRIYDLGKHQWDMPKLRLLLEQILGRNTFFEDFKLEGTFARIGHRKLLLNARRLHQKGKLPAYILLAMEDVTAKGQPLAKKRSRKTKK